MSKSNRHQIAGKTASFEYTLDLHKPDAMNGKRGCLRLLVIPCDNSPMPIKLLFVCMGNICRSPAAEGVFLHLAKTGGVGHLFEVDSAGTGGWHAGNPADHRSAAEGRRRGFHLPSRARKVAASDMEDFDLIICMDIENHADLMDMGFPEKKLRMLLEWHPQNTGEDVPDPYYGGADGFVHMYDLIVVACDRLLEDLVKKE